METNIVSLEASGLRWRPAPFDRKS